MNKIDKQFERFEERIGFKINRSQHDNYKLKLAIEKEPFLQESENHETQSSNLEKATKTGVNYSFLYGVDW